MDWLIKLLPLITAFVLPIIKHWIVDKREQKKISSDKISNDLKNAEEYEELDKNSLSQLAKDRWAKKLFDNKEINNDEVTFFLKYCDADFWINKYLKIKYKIEIIRDENGDIEGFESKHTKKNTFFWSFIYVFSMLIFATPYVFFKSYSVEIQKTIEAQNYLLTAEIIIFPILFLFIGLLSLSEGGKSRDGKAFVDDFKNKARLI